MLERKYLAHMIDAAFDMTYASTNIVRIGKDLEELSFDLAPDVETVKNILGETSVRHNGFEATASIEPLYVEDYDDALSAKLIDIVMNRLTGDACKTTYYDIWLTPSEDAGGEPTVYKAWREDCLIVPQSYGGDTSGVQIPFNIHPVGNRVEGTYDLGTKKFTPKSTGL